MNKHELYKYSKSTNKLEWFVCTKGRKYFDGDDYSWELWEEYQEIKGKLKNKILKANTENIKNTRFNYVYLYLDGRDTRR